MLALLEDARHRGDRRGRRGRDARRGRGGDRARRRTRTTAALRAAHRPRRRARRARRRDAAPRADDRQHRRDGRRPVRDRAVRDPDRPPRGPRGPRARRRGPARARGRPDRDVGAAPGRPCRTRSSPTPRRPGCIAAGEVDAVLVGADRVVRRTATSSAPPARTRWRSRRTAAGIPFIVCAPTDRGGPRARRRAPVPRSRSGRPGPVISAGGTRVAPEGTPVRNPRPGPHARGARDGDRHRAAASRSRTHPCRRRRPLRRPTRPIRAPGAVLMATVAVGTQTRASSSARHDRSRAAALVPRARPPVRRVRDLRPRGPRVRSDPVGDRDVGRTRSSPSRSSTAA